MRKSRWTFFEAIGAIPVRRGAGQAALDALDLQRQLLDEGLAVALYPEGTRSTDGRLYKGRTGVAFLALQTGAPVVPVGLIGTDKVMPVGAKMPTLSERITVRFGEPLDLSPHGPATSGRARPRPSARPSRHSATPTSACSPSCGHATRPRRSTWHPKRQ